MVESCEPYVQRVSGNRSGARCACSCTARDALRNRRADAAQPEERLSADGTLAAAARGPAAARVILLPESIEEVRDRGFGVCAAGLSAARAGGFAALPRGSARRRRRDGRRNGTARIAAAYAAQRRLTRRSTEKRKTAALQRPPFFLRARALLRLHADRAVQTNDFAVEHRVVEDLLDEHRELHRLAEARGTSPSAPSASCTSCGMPSSIGVSKMPGAMVITRIALRDRSRAIGSVISATPPSTRRRPPCPIWPSGRHRRRAHDHAALAGRVRLVLRHGVAASRIMLNVPMRLTAIVFEKRGRAGEGRHGRPSSTRAPRPRS